MTGCRPRARRGGCAIPARCSAVAKPCGLSSGLWAASWTDGYSTEATSFRSLDEGVHLLVAALVVSLAEDGARMDRRGHVGGEVRVEPAAALLRDAELLAEERLRRGRAEADEHRGRTTASSASSHGRHAAISGASASRGCAACRAPPT